MSTSIKLLLRYIFVGALSLLPLIMVLMVVNYLEELGVSAYLSLHNYTNSFEITIGLMAAVVALFAILGYSIEKYGRSVFVAVIDSAFEKIPAIRSVYSVSKKVAAMLSGGEDGTKKEVVLVEYPKENLWVPAYLLNRHKNIPYIINPKNKPMSVLPHQVLYHGGIIRIVKIFSTSLSKPSEL